MNIEDENYLAHYGILRKSGRYPWGSGKTQGERNKTFIDTVEGMRKSGMSEAEIARGFGMTTSQLRNLKSIAKNAQKQADINMAERLKKKGYSNVAIGERMNRPESSIRALLEPGQKERADVLKATSDMLRSQVDQKHYVDIGSGVEQHLGISNTKLKIAVAKLEEEGYMVHRVSVEQLGTGQNTTIKVLAAPKTSWGEVYRNRDQIKQITGYSEDGGKSYNRILPPLSVSSKRIAVRYAKDGGAAADGVIFVRPGLKDLSLGGSSYAQVRVAVDGSHYLKGMAVYKHDLPHGVDLMFNTNKSDTGNKLDAMKPMKNDPDSPFGSFISHQIQETGAGGKTHVTSAMNLVNEEGDWERWSSTLSSQMLSKQSLALAKTQLGMASERKTNELTELRNLSNPAVKKKLLEAYADDADSSAVHLKAAALPRQGTHVILPVASIKEHEIYAPNYRDGERVALIRHPHGGPFEIPELTVNNRNPEAKKLLGNAKDAVGIHHKVAEKLSGADFDGDTVLVIPNNQGRVKSAPALEGLKGFDPKAAYPAYEGMTRMSSRTTQIEMGKVTNLITDMTIRGATNTELARAVRHSMVVIDAEKHNLDYKQSAIDNGISQLKQKYQSRPGRSGLGASTVISNSGTTSTIRVPERKQGFKVDPVTGKKIHTETGATYVDAKTGKTVVKTTEVAKLSVNDAHSYSSGTPIEKVYADHSNKMKALANAARKEAAATRSIVYSPEAKAAHAHEVASLNAKLNLALRNSPLERQAQIIANTVVAQKLHANPGMEKSEIKKLKAQALETARARTGAKKQRIEITEAEWKAIQAGAITNSKLHQILNHADLDQVKKLATPKTAQSLSVGRKNQAINMLRNGHTQAEVADALGVSVATLKRSLSGGDG